MSIPIPYRHNMDDFIRTTIDPNLIMKELRAFQERINCRPLNMYMANADLIDFSRVINGSGFVPYATNAQLDAWAIVKYWAAGLAQQPLDLPLLFWQPLEISQIMALRAWIDLSVKTFTKFTTLFPGEKVKHVHYDRKNFVFGHFKFSALRSFEPIDPNHPIGDENAGILVPGGWVTLSKDEIEEIIEHEENAEWELL